MAGGRFLTTGPTGTWTFPAAGAAPTAFNAAVPLYQRVLDRNLQVPLERGLLSGRLTYDAGGGTELFLEGSYARTSADLTLEPSFFQFAARQGVNAYDLGPIPTNAPGRAAFLTTVGATNINNAQTQSRRLTEYGVRTSSIDRDLYRVAVGAKGDLGRFKWQAYYQYGRVDMTQEDGNSIDRNKFYAGMNNCQGAYALPGCVPINIFGYNSITQAVIDWTVIPDVLTHIRSQQHVASAFISGDLLTIGGSALGAVIGVEYRKETTKARVHPSLADGSNATRQIAAASGSTDVKEVFGELRLPLFDDLLELNGAARLSRYSTVGTEVTWNTSATLRPTSFLSFRASYGKATRAPNVGELFSSINTATSVVSDPCANDIAPQDGVIDPGFVPPASCVAQLGAGYIVSQAPGGTPTGNRTGGNPNLRSETGRTFSAGAVFRVPSLLRFTGSIDYYDIKLDDVIGSLSPVEVVRQCYVDQTGLPDAFCSLISRNATGSRGITTISTQLFNIADERVRGLDAQGRISWPVGSLSMALNVSYAHLFERSRREFQGGNNNDFTGRFDAIRDQGNVQLELSNDRVTIAYGARILGTALKGTSAANLAAVDDPALPGDNGNRIAPYVYHDLQAAFRTQDRYTFTLGVKNLTDRQPPLITSFSNSGLSGSASVTAGGIYDTRGRFFYAQVGVEF
ncbi:MAG: TonB-dependent receptor [Sphingomonadales bacterium]|nr:TonB-dependent receptor [Sphingomonadales bacterium]